MIDKINNRCSVAIEIYGALIDKCKDLMEEKFGKPTSYFDAERQRVISVAHDIFLSCVSYEDIQKLGDDYASPTVICGTKNDCCARDAKDFIIDAEDGMSGGDSCGITEEDFTGRPG
jgi:hypothetical protein